MPALTLPTDDSLIVTDYLLGKPLRVIAKEHGLSKGTIWRRLKKHRTAMRKPGHGNRGGRRA